MDMPEKSLWAGLIRKLCSDGTTTLGTRRTAEEESLIQSSPIANVVGGAGETRQLDGNEAGSQPLNQLVGKVELENHIAGQKCSFLQMYQYFEDSEGLASRGIHDPGTDT